MATIVSFLARRDGAVVDAATAGDGIELALVASDGCEGAQIAGQQVELSPDADGTLEGSLTVQVTADMPGDFEAQVLKGGEVADSQTLHLDIAGAAQATATLEIRPATLARASAFDGSRAGKASFSSLP